MSHVPPRSVSTARFLLCAVALWGCAPPPIPVPEYDAPAGEAAVARGRYLAEHVTLCVDCHSERDWTRFSGPVVPGTESLGGAPYVKSFKLPDDVVLPAPSLRPDHLGSWSDGELYRAIINGIGQDGRALFPAHPYFQYRELARSDVGAIIAWLRTLPPGSRELPERDLRYDFVEGITTLFPWRVTQPERPPKRGTIANGRYISRIASCWWCHSQTDELGFIVPDGDWKGGTAIHIPPPGKGIAESPNLTPHPSALGTWTEEVFVQRFRGMTAERVREGVIEEGGFNSYMAWTAYSGISDQDLRDLWAYLQRVRPAPSKVERWRQPAAGKGN